MPLFFAIGHQLMFTTLQWFTYVLNIAALFSMQFYNLHEPNKLDYYDKRHSGK